MTPELHHLGAPANVETVELCELMPVAIQLYPTSAADIDDTHFAALAEIACRQPSVRRQVQGSGERYR